MAFVTNEKAIKNSIASVEMEGFSVSAECVAWCDKLLNNEITMEQYIEFVKQYAGV